MWAVTVTGAPKTWAMQFIEDHEETPRRWYGGAVGKVGFDGSMNTGLTLRTAHITGGIAAVRAGATLLYDSVPAAEEKETQIKARALLETLDEASRMAPGDAKVSGEHVQVSARDYTPRVLLVDHQDSFVHTLGDYFRQQGAEVTTLRFGFSPALLDSYAPDLVVMSPGPGRPADFGCAALLDEVYARHLPSFGVCLGLQAMVEHAGGALSLLPEPAHGKPGLVRVSGGSLLAGLPGEFTAGRYHSLYAPSGEVRGGFAVTASLRSPDGADVVMAIEDEAAGRWAVQFHPESILTAFRPVRAPDHRQRARPVSCPGACACHSVSRLRCWCAVVTVLCYEERRTRGIPGHPAEGRLRGDGRLPARGGWRALAGKTGSRPARQRCAGPRRVCRQDVLPLLGARAQPQRPEGARRPRGVSAEHTQAGARFGT